jgi:alanine racemase
MTEAERPSRAEARAGAVLEIDLDCIAENWRRLIDRLNPGAGIAAVVKADAYGLGMPKVAQKLAAAGCELFFVGTLEEALALRKVLPSTQIGVLNGPARSTAGAMRRARLIPVLNDLGQLALWRAQAKAEPLPAMLHVDTGMARLGMPAPEIAKLAADAPALLGGVELKVLMSHLACADDPDHPLNAQQLAAFRAVVKALPPVPLTSIAGSSGIFLGPDYHLDFVRPGAALYGVNPTPKQSNPMLQVVRLKARILQVRDIDMGVSVGYGAAHRMERPGRVATIGIGYADGWFRSSSHRGSASIAGQRVPVIGRISMDLVTLDVTGIDPALTRPGNLVDLLDATYGVDQVAEAAGTIGYEVLTALGRRYHRVYRSGTGA